MYYIAHVHGFNFIFKIALKLQSEVTTVHCWPWSPLVINATNICVDEQPARNEIKEGDEVRYTSGGVSDGEPAKEERARVVKVHSDAEGAHYTIRTLGTDGKEKNTTAEHLSKVFGLSDLGKADNLVDALFGLEMEEEFKCEESGESKVSLTKGWDSHA